MKINIRYELLFIYIIFLLNNNIFGLLNISDDIVLVIVFVFILFITIKYKNLKQRYMFKKEVLFITCLIIISSIVSYKLYGQGIMLGLRAQRKFFIVPLMYFPISKLLGSGIITRNDIEKIFYRIGISEIIIYTLYYLSGGNIGFLNINFDYRYGDIRLRVNSITIEILFLIVVNNILKGKNRKVNLLIGIIDFIFVAFILKTRLLVVGILGVAVVGVFFARKQWVLKIVSVLAIICMIPIALNLTIIKDIITTLIEDDPNDIRKLGKEYYIEQLQKTPILGRGYINTQSEEAFRGAGMDKKYYLNDNGIYGFAFMYGLIGMIWIIDIVIRCLKYGINIYKKYNDYLIFLYICYNLIVCMNMASWYWSVNGWFTLIYMFAIIDYHKKCYDGGKIENV